MKRIIFSTGLILLCVQLIAQQEYFVFIQDGSRQPFYARIGDRNYSSSPIGHLLIPSLKDSAYLVYIGFPRSLYPEQLFRISPSKKDRGYELRNTAGKNWELLDLQNQQLVKAAQGEQSGADNSAGAKKTDSYSRLMAGVVDDSAVMYTSVAKPELRKETAKKEDSATGNLAGINKPVATVSNQPKQETPTKPATNPISRDTASSALITRPPAKEPLSNLATKAPEPGVSAVQAKKAASPDSSVGMVSKLPSEKESVVAMTEKSVVGNPAGGGSNPGTIPDGAKTPLIKDTSTAAGANNTITKSPDQGITSPVVKAPERETPKNQIPDSMAKRTVSVAPPSSEPEKAVVLTPPVDTAAARPVTREQTTAANNPPQRAIIVTSSVPGRKGIMKLSTEVVVGGKQMIFIDATSSVTDTIVLIIPKDDEWAKVSPQAADVQPDSHLQQQAEQPVADSLKAEDKPVLIVINSDCRNFAQDSDVDKLRVKILSEKTTDDKVIAARSVFKTRCFTTKQVRALSELFIDDAGRYQLLDAAYPYTSDSGNFKSMINLLKDEYYINRFKAMVRN